MFDASRMFVAQCGHEIWNKGLKANFTLHLTSLYDYGLLNATQKLQIIRQLNALANAKPEHSEFGSTRDMKKESSEELER